MALFPTLASQIKRLSTVRLLPDVINGYNLLVKGLSQSFTLPATDFNDSVIIQKDAGPSAPALFVDNNVNGQHANFGGGVLTVADAGIASGPTAPFAIGSTLDVTGAAALHSTLGVTALSTLTGGFASGANSSVTGNLGVSGNETVGGTLGVTGLSTLTGGFNALASGTVQGNLNVTGIIAGNGQPIAAAIQQGVLGSNFPLPSAYANLVGCAVPLTAGNWICMLVCDFLEQQGSGSDLTQTFQGRIFVSAGAATIANAAATVILAGVTIGQRATVSQVWPVSVPTSASIQAQAQKTGGTGGSIALATFTNLVAFFVGKP